ncbi:MAG: peptide chain release factor N(5)-glutamine methyltransferase [Pseudomonadota bacterium]
MSIGEWRKLAQKRLQTVSDATALEADTLLMQALGISRSAILSAPERALDPQQVTQLNRWLDLREDHVPLAFITGSQPFWDLDLAVDASTLVPRADTETLVERALQRISQTAPQRAADLGTGSGAIGIVLALSRSRSQIVAVDQSAEALTVAAANALNHAADNITFVHSDWFAQLHGELFDVIVSNPPYVESTYAGLATELRHEPRSALVSGSDGLDDIRHIAAHAPNHLHPHGWLLLEHGDQQADAVSGILRAAGFSRIQCYPDLGGRPRVTEAQLIC